MPFIPDNQPVQRTGFIPDQKSVGGFAGNVAKSGASFVGSVGGAILHPIATAKNIIDLGSSVVSLVLPGEQGNEDLARQVGQFYADRYGGADKALNTLYNDPVGTLADVSTVLGGAGAVIKGVGTAGKINSLARVGKMTSTVSKVADPLSITGKLFSKLPVKTAFAKVGTKLEKAGESLPTKGLGNPAKQADLAAKSGISVGKFIDENNLWDRTPESASRVKTNIINQYNDLSMKSGKRIPLSQVVDKIDNAIAELQGGSGKFSDSVQSQVAELTRRRTQLMAIAGEGLDSLPEDIAISTLTDFRKNALDPDIPRSMFNLDARGSGTAMGAKKTRDILRSEINASDPALERLGLNYGMAKGVEDIFRKSQSRANNRQLISLSKVGTTGIGGMLGGIPGAVAGYAVDQITTDPRFLKAASKTLTKVGGAVKNAKFPAVPAYADTTYKIAKVGRMVNQSSSTNLSGKSQTKQGGSMPTTNSKQQTNSTLQSSPSLDTSYLQVKTKPLKSTNPFSKIKKVTKGSFY